MLHVSWVSKKFTINFDKESNEYGSKWPSHTTLATLLERCSQETGVNTRNIKLLATGGTLITPTKDIKPTLSFVSLKKSKIHPFGIIFDGQMAVLVLILFYSIEFD